MNKYLLPHLFIVLSFICFSNVEAYVQNRTQADSAVHWADSISTVDIFVNSTNTQGLSDAFVQTQVANAVAQWNGKSRMGIRKFTTAGTGQENLNEVYFTTDPTIFGSAVVGITQVYFKNNTGEILEADILINDSVSFSTNVNRANYLGNVITHEMGHFLGLGHSPVAGSTMFYALSRGQNQIASDDKAGIYSIYPNSDPSKGSITGKMVGGKSLINVFGVHVQAISLKTGQVMGAAFSEADGSFVINGLPKNDQYYIYSAPTNVTGLPTKYASARYDFCDSSKSYRGSFFQACGSSHEGYPQSVSLNSGTVNVGNITIRCGLDVPTNFMSTKNDYPASFDMQSPVTSGLGNVFTGYFSSQQFLAGTKDYIRLNYSHISSWNSVSSGTLFVELKVLNQAFYSVYKPKVEVRNYNGNFSALPPEYVQEADGYLNLETTVRIPINSNGLYSSDNDFEVSIEPTPIELMADTTFAEDDYFPALDKFEDSLHMYLVTASIVVDNGNGTYSQVSSKVDQLSDNSLCPDAINTYALTNYAVKGTTAAASSKKKDGFLGCGTVDMSGGPGSGPGGFFIGLILSLILCSLTSSIIKHNRPKLGSKIA